jgi:hypothetical protein
MRELDGLCATLRQVSVHGELWVDGSFLTQKNDPADVDVVLLVDAAYYDNGTPGQKAAIQWLLDNPKHKMGSPCDGYVCFRYSPSHHLFTINDFMKAYWIRQFGFNRSDSLKGIAVVTL